MNPKSTVSICEGMGLAQQINILFLIDYFHRTGGTERHLAHLVMHLPKDKFKCTIIAFDLGSNPLIDEIRASGTPILHLPVAREYTPAALRRAIQLSIFIKKNNFDIIQTYHQKSDSFGAIVAKLSGAKHIISSKRDNGQLKKNRHFFINRRCKPIFDRFIVVADAVGDVIIQKEKVDRSRIVRLYNGVDEKVYKPAMKEESLLQRNRMGLAEDDFVVGMVAGFRPEKAYDIFFDGAIAASKTIPNLKLIAVGGGPLLEHFRTAYGKLTDGPEVIFSGAIQNVRDYLAAMDVGCLVPRSNEGFSNSVLEKMAMGLPLIVTNVGGNAEAVTHQQNGLVIPPNNAEAFKNALIHMHSDPATRLKMGRYSRLLVEKQFTLDQMCKFHENLYLSVLADDSIA